MVRFEPLEVALGQELLLIELLALTHDDVIVQVPTTSPPQPAVLLQVPPEELPHPAFTNAARQPMIEANVEIRIAPSSTKLRSDAIILPARHRITRLERSLLSVWPMPGPIGVRACLAALFGLGVQGGCSTVPPPVVAPVVAPGAQAALRGAVTWSVDWGYARARIQRPDGSIQAIAGNGDSSFGSPDQ